MKNEERDNNNNIGKKFKSCVLNPNDHIKSAKEFLLQCANGECLRFYQGDFYGWSGSCYRREKAQPIEALVWNFLNSAYLPEENGCSPRFAPNRAKVANVLAALRATCTIIGENSPPFWIGQADQPPANELVAVKNGLLHLPTYKLYSHSPRYFNVNAVDFDFNSSAPAPEEWLRFLRTVWSDDPETISTLQEFFGYAVSGDTGQQKIFALIGPPRSGKGTIAKVLESLIGSENVVSPSASSLGTAFGLEPLIGKKLAIMQDARFGQSVDKNAVTERLLSISGEDSMTIDRKHKDAWNGRLKTRLLLISNELPFLADASGALPSRFITITTSESFYGREDQNLLLRLKCEMSGILNWAIEGWRQLNARGFFVQPHSGKEAMTEMEALSSPVRAFVKDRCVLVAGRMIPIDTLFSAWEHWCAENGCPGGTKQSFGRQLRAAVPGIAVKQYQTPVQERRYVGIGLA